MLAFVMNHQNLKSTNEIASTYVNGVSRQIINHYETITSIRKDEGNQIIDDVNDISDIDELKNKISDQANISGFTFSGLYDLNGNVEIISGDDIIKNKNFKVYYQPKYNIESSNSEALVRWIHPKYGLISPGVFIPLFEERGLIRILDRYVWEEAIKQVALWNKKFNKIIPVSINVSRVDLLDDNIVFILDDLVNKYNVDPNNIYLEITESAYNADINNICDIILRLKEKGFRIEIDDFGSGYSSLNALATIPFDVLKLDMIFVRQMYNNEKTLKMVEIVSDIAKFLNVILIAEGVETKDQLEQLKKFGYHIIQGYYFSKPLTKEDFEEKLRIEYGNN